MTKIKADVQLAKRCEAAAPENNPNKVKRYIREDFLKEHHDKKINEKVFSNAYQEVGDTLGKYMNYGQLVLHFGRVDVEARTSCGFEDVREGVPSAWQVG